SSVSSCSWSCSAASARTRCPPASPTLRRASPRWGPPRRAAPPTRPRRPGPRACRPGTDRQVRGRLLAVLRGAAPAAVTAAALDACWDEPVQRARALDSLVVDGLVDPLPDGRYALPGGQTQ